MFRDHRPYSVKKLYRQMETAYVRRFLAPQFESLGKNFIFFKPWHVEVFGGPVRIGSCVNIIAAPDRKVRFSVWSHDRKEGEISIGDYSLVCPGVRISSAIGIDIGKSCMMAGNVYITDSDWHDQYNRLSLGRPAPIRIGENVWIGDSAMICKGVTIGRNSIIGAGSVVVRDVPENAVAAGNPAKVVKQLDPEKEMIKREDWFRDPEDLFRRIDRMDREMLKENSFSKWLRHIFLPVKED